VVCPTVRRLRANPAGCLLARLVVRAAPSAFRGQTGYWPLIHYALPIYSPGGSSIFYPPIYSIIVMAILRLSGFEPDSDCNDINQMPPIYISYPHRIARRGSLSVSPPRRKRKLLNLAFLTSFFQFLFAPIHINRQIRQGRTVERQRRFVIIPSFVDFFR